MKLIRYLRQLFWAYCPHRCRFGRAWDSRRGLHGERCRRCGTAVWFNVSRQDGGTNGG